MEKKRLKNDLILIGVLVAVVLLAIGAWCLFREQGDRVVVYVNHEEYASYPLSKDLTVDIVTGEDGTQINRLVIKDGKAYVEYANCAAVHGEACTKKKPISYEWQSIICSPHEVVITVKAVK